jgi:AmmeMemoRadiSam system protein B
MMINIRYPAVAGAFYNSDSEMLKKQIEGCFRHKLGPRAMKKHDVVAAVVPHAGYAFSGPIAAWVYSRLEKANYIILGTNHSGMGSRFALMRSGLWKTPLGEIAIDQQMAERLLEGSDILEYDVISHEHEHSIEVQLPFLQYRFGNEFKFVPINILGEYPDESLLDACKAVGKSIANVVKKQKDGWIILASSDFSHYVPQKKIKGMDLPAINAIKKLDEEKFFDNINEKDASICGFGAIATAIAAAKELKAKKTELLKYATSGDVSGDTSSVVGYASIIIY